MPKIVDKIITATFVCVLAVIWFFSTKYYEKPKQYSIVVYDIFGKETTIEGLRIDFKTIKVAMNFIKEYQNRFPQYNFSLAPHSPHIKRRYLVLRKPN